MSLTQQQIELGQALRNANDPHLSEEARMGWADEVKRLQAEISQEKPRSIIEIQVSELEDGDQVLDKGRLVYTVLEIIRDEPTERMARVRWMDGGHDIRVWDAEHFSQTVQVCRES